jgi:hypothetical protein
VKLGSASAVVLLDRLVTLLLLLGLLSLGSAIVLDIELPFMGLLTTLLLVAATAVTVASWGRFSQWIATYLHRRLVEPWILLSSTLRDSVAPKHGEREGPKGGSRGGQVVHDLVDRTRQHPRERGGQRAGLSHPREELSGKEEQRPHEQTPHSPQRGAAEIDRQTDGRSPEEP